jgi:hypothetical protein
VFLFSFLENLYQRSCSQAVRVDGFVVGLAKLEIIKIFSKWENRKINFQVWQVQSQAIGADGMARP